MKTLKCCNPKCDVVFPVSHDCIRVTCGQCMLAGFKAPRLETPDLFAGGGKMADQPAEVLA